MKTLIKNKTVVNGEYYKGEIKLNSENEYAFFPYDKSHSLFRSTISKPSRGDNCEIISVKIEELNRILGEVDELNNKNKILK